MPILDCFLFEVQDGVLTITASDSENTMKSKITLDDYDTNGAFCITNRTILDAMKELAEQPVTIDVNLETLQTKIVYLNGMYNIVSLSADEYPRTMPCRITPL